MAAVISTWASDGMDYTAPSDTTMATSGCSRHDVVASTSTGASRGMDRTTPSSTTVAVAG